MLDLLYNVALSILIAINAGCILLLILSPFLRKYVRPKVMKARWQKEFGNKFRAGQCVGIFDKVEHQPWAMRYFNPDKLPDTMYPLRPYGVPELYVFYHSKNFPFECSKAEQRAILVDHRVNFLYDRDQHTEKKGTLNPHFLVYHFVTKRKYFVPCDKVSKLESENEEENRC